MPSCGDLCQLQSGIIILTGLITPLQLMIINANVMDQKQHWIQHILSGAVDHCSPLSVKVQIQQFYWK